MKHKQDMNEDKLVARLKKADPAIAHNLDADVIERGINRANHKRQVTRRPSFVLAAAGAALVTVSLTLTSVLTSGHSGGALISLGATQGDSTTQSRTQSSSALAKGSEGLSDMGIAMPAVNYTYVAGDGISDANSREHVYQVALSGDPLEHLRDLQKFFQVKGTIENLNKDGSYDPSGDPVYSVGSTDGMSESLSLYWTGSGYWSYYNPAAYTDGAEMNLPNKSEARAEALRVFNQTGLDASASDITVYATEGYVQATASLKLNGQDTAIEWYINWGNSGEIGSVSGSFAKFIDKGEFDTVSAKSAVERLDDWRYSGAIASRFWSETSIVADDTAHPEYKGGLTEEPLEVTVTITKAMPSYLLITDASGTSWMVPGYIFTDERGWLMPVFSLAEGVVEMPALAEVAPGELVREK